MILLTLALAPPAGAVETAATQVSPGVPSETSYRVFLIDGSALESYGEAAHVADRLVFNLIVRGTGDQFTLQLMSLPASAIDVPKTERYAETMRARFYATTRGEVDYAAMSAEVAHTLDQLSAVTDKQQRLRLAEQARGRLLSWSQAHYAYRARDIGELSGLFDEVITEMRAAAGEPGVTLDLSRGPRPFEAEPLLGTPAQRPSIALARAAAAAADIPEERLAILRAALGMAGDETAMTGLRDELRADLTAESEAGSRYAALIARLDARASAALERGDVGTLDALRQEAVLRDRALGFRRRRDMQALVTRLDRTLEAARAYRLALDHYAFVRRGLLAYERRIRSALTDLGALTPMLKGIRDMRSVSVDRIDAALRRLGVLRRVLNGITPPSDLASVHTAIGGTVQMASEAFSRRRQAIVTNQLQTAREASTAAAGALLLAEQAHRDLVAGLYPPKLP